MELNVGSKLCVYKPYSLRKILEYSLFWEINTRAALCIREYLQLVNSSILIILHWFHLAARAGAATRRLLAYDITRDENYYYLPQYASQIF